MKARQGDTTNQSDESIHLLTATQSQESIDAEINRLYWRSWLYCIGKFSVPAVALVIPASMIGVLSQSYPGESEESRFNDGKAMVFTGVGGLGLFACAIGVAKTLHDKQNSIDAEIQSLRDQKTSNAP